MIVRMVNSTSWILMKRVSTAHSPLSTSGPPGASCGFGVNRTSGIIVAGSRPQDCSSARSMPETPVPVRTAVVEPDERQVDHQRHVEVVAANHLRHVLDRERRGEHQLERADQVRRRPAQLLERPLQVLQVGVQVGARRRQRVVGSHADPAERRPPRRRTDRACRRNA